MEIGNFTSQENKDFPMDCETLDMMQRNTALTAALGNIAGDKLILTGCDLTNGGSQRTAGYVFVRTKDFPQGEVMHWEGGAISGGMYIKLEDVQVNALGVNYPKAYTKRTLAAGVGDENFNWKDFVKPTTPAELLQKIADLTKKIEEMASQTDSEPLGVVKMWAGIRVPDNYALCDGAALKTDEYPELYAALGTAFNTTADHNGNKYTTQSGYFRLPDLRGRFIVGYNDIDSEYNKYGNAGGEKKHILTIDEMPPHNHKINFRTEKWGDNANSRPFPDAKGEDSYKANTLDSGNGASHENRPPYYALAYIIKVR